MDIILVVQQQQPEQERLSLKKQLLGSQRESRQHFTHVHDVEVNGEGRLNINGRGVLVDGGTIKATINKSRIEQLLLYTKEAKLEFDNCSIGRMAVRNSVRNSATYRGSSVTCNRVEADHLSFTDKECSLVDMTSSEVQNLTINGASMKTVINIKNSTVDIAAIHKAAFKVEIVDTQFNRLDMAGLNSGMELTLNRVTAPGTNFTGVSCLFKRTAITNSDVSDSDFTGAWIPGADFTGSDIRGSKFYGANLWKARLPHLPVPKTVAFDNGMRYIPDMFKDGSGMWIVPAIYGGWYVYAPNGAFDWVPLLEAVKRLEGKPLNAVATAINTMLNGGSKVHDQFVKYHADILPRLAMM